MERLNDKPQPGDRIIAARADGLFDVATGDEILLKEEIATLDSAVGIARGGLEGGRLWWRHHSTPTVTEPYRLHRPATKKAKLRDVS